MSEHSPTPLTPRVPGTYRGACLCNFWIVTKAQLNRLRCPACGDVVKHATVETLLDANVVDVVKEPAPEKKKRGPKPKPSGGMLDAQEAA